MSASSPQADALRVQIEEFNTELGMPASEAVLLNLAIGRKTKFLELMRLDPAVALQVVLPDDVRSKLSATVLKEVEEPVIEEGVLKVSVIDYPTSHETIYEMQSISGGALLTMYFAQIPDTSLISGDQMLVSAFKLGNDLLVVDELANMEKLSSSSVSANTIGEQKTLVILINFADNRVEHLTPAQIQDFYFNTTTGLSAFYFENSFQQTSFTGQVKGWYQLSINSSGCDTNLFFTEAIKAVDPTINFSTAGYSHIVAVFPRVASCGFGGRSTVGKTSVSTQEGFIEVSTSWINGSLNLRTYIHEMGHGLGVHHSRALECATATLPADITGCTLLEYGDPFDVMGGALLRHLSANQKETLGWFSPGNIITINTNQATTTYTLAPIESKTTSPQVLKILQNSAQQSWYYVENREPIGFDNTLNVPPTTIPAGTLTNAISGAVIHQKSNESVTNKLLDMTPNSQSNTLYPPGPGFTTPLVSPDFFDAALPIGSTFSGPGNVSIIHAGNTGSNLQVRVNVNTIDKPPVLGTVSPSFGGSLANQTVSLVTTASDLNGWQNLAQLHLLINTGLVGLNAPYLRYNQNTNKLSLRKDDNSAWLTGCTPGSATILENTTTKLNCATTTVSGTGNILTVNWSLTFKTAAVSPTVKNVYLYAIDDAAAFANWGLKGTWLIGPNTAPIVGTVTPNPGTSTANSPTVMTTTFLDANGRAQLRQVYVLVNTALSVLNVPYLMYDQNTNLLYLRKDDNSAWLGPCTPGASTVLQNTSVSLNCATTTIGGTGNTLSIAWRLTFKTPLRGTKNVYLKALDDLGLVTAWFSKGTWTIQ